MDEEQQLQNVRLLLMLYRQGWLDAMEYLNRQTMKIARDMHKQYLTLGGDGKR